MNRYIPFVSILLLPLAASAVEGSQSRPLLPIVLDEISISFFKTRGTVDFSANPITRYRLTVVPDHCQGIFSFSKGGLKGKVSGFDLDVRTLCDEVRGERESVKTDHYATVQGLALGIDMRVIPRLATRSVHRRLPSVRNVEFTVLPGVSTEFRSEVPEGLTFEIEEFQGKYFHLKLVRNEAADAWISAFTKEALSRMEANYRGAHLTNEVTLLNDDFREYTKAINYREMNRVLLEFGVMGQIEALKKGIAEMIQEYLVKNRSLLSDAPELSFLKEHPAGTFVLKRSSGADGNGAWIIIDSEQPSKQDEL